MQGRVKLLSLPQASARKLVNKNPKVLQVSRQRTHSACLARAGTRQPVLVRTDTRHACYWVPSQYKLEPISQTSPTTRKRHQNTQRITPH